MQGDSEIKEQGQKRNFLGKERLERGGEGE
jgi:hypothetical protein